MPRGRKARKDTTLEHLTVDILTRPSVTEHLTSKEKGNLRLVNKQACRAVDSTIKILSLDWRRLLLQRPSHLDPPINLVSSKRDTDRAIAKSVQNDKAYIVSCLSRIGGLIQTGRWVIDTLEVDSELLLRTGQAFTNLVGGHLDALTCLAVQNGGREVEDQFSALLVNCSFESLKKLDLRRIHVAQAALKVLAKAPWVKQLEEFELGTVSLDGAGEGMYSFISACLNLKRAKIGKCYKSMSPEVASALAGIHGLEELRLFYNTIEDATMERLANARWPNLNLLEFDVCFFSPEAAEILCQGRWDYSNWKLDFRCCATDAASAAKLIQAPWMNGVTSLKLSHRIGHLNNLPPEFHSHRLQKLSLGQLNAEGVRNFVQNEANCPNLKELSLARCTVTDAGVAALTESNWNFTKLDLTYCGLTAVVVRILLNSNWHDLESLKFSFAGEVDALTLVHMGRKCFGKFPKLAHLEVSGKYNSEWKRYQDDFDEQLLARIVAFLNGTQDF